MKRNARLLIFLVEVSLILCVRRQPLMAQSSISAADLDKKVASILSYGYDCKFDDALNGADEIISIMPGDPEGYFYKGGIYKRMMEEGCLTSDDSTMMKVRSLIDRACRLSEQELDKQPDNVMAYFYYAASLVYRAWYESKNHDWLAVLSDGTKAKKTLEKAIEIDPNFYDAYTGIGAFNCYAARIPWYMKPIALVLGVHGDEDEGIAQLKKAVEFGKYAKIEAQMFLGSIAYVNREDYSSSAKLLLELHKRFPNNLYITQYLCKDYYELQNYDETINLASSVLSEVDPAGFCQRERLSFIQFYRGKSFERLGEEDKAIADYDTVVKLDVNHYAGKDALAALKKLRDQ